MILEDIPGYLNDGTRFYLYIQCESDNKFIKLIEKIAVSDTSNSPKNGLLFEGSIIIIPDGRSFHGVSYKEKFPWEVRLVEYCKKNNINTGIIVNKEFHISSGEKYELMECNISC